METKDKCAICLTSLYRKEIIKLTPCQHMFHKTCINHVIITEPSCPICCELQLQVKKQLIEKCIKRTCPRIVNELLQQRTDNMTGYH